MGIRLWPFQRINRTSSKPQILVAALTDVGRVRTGNEDSYSTLWGEKSPPGVDALIVVADGMGGHAAGEVASSMAVDGVVELMSSAVGSPHVGGQKYLEVLGRVLQNVNTTVYQAGQDADKRGMGTTCTVVVIKEDQLYVSHVGDSRAYLLRAGELHQITEDHSWVEQQVAIGALSREEARNHPDRNVITRAIGLDPQVKVDGYLVSLANGDVLLLCSDGLTTMVEDAEIASILSGNNPQEACKALIEAANRQGGQDNITVAIANITGGTVDAPPITSPADGAKTEEITRPPSVLKRFSKSVLRLGR